MFLRNWLHVGIDGKSVKGSYILKNIIRHCQRETCCEEAIWCNAVTSHIIKLSLSSISKHDNKYKMV